MNEKAMEFPTAREQWDKLSPEQKDVLATEAELIAARKEKEDLLVKVGIVDAKISVAMMKLESKGESVEYYKNNPV